MMRILRRMQPGVTEEELLRQFDARTRLGRCIAPEEIADMVLFLASEESRMCTGQTYVVDAGTLL